MKRQRSRGGRKPGGHHQPNRTLESSGPEIKVRGPAAHIYERYLNLARDASGAGDRVMAENYLQHAEHYFRVLRAQQPSMPAPQPSSDRFGSHEMDYGDDEEGADEGGETEAAGEGGEGGEQPEAEFPAQPQGQPHQQQGGQGNDRDGDFRRRRGRRNRFRPNGEGGEREGGQGESQQGGERQSAEHAERGPAERGPEGQPRERRPREPREPRDGDQNDGGEGFSNGPKPAFLRTE